MSHVDAVSVDAVVEARAECSDLERARAALAEALAGAQAPRRSRDVNGRWSVTVHVTAVSGAASAKSAEATIVDDRGTVVAQRTVNDPGARACLPLARAVGAWASLVLDDELGRARDDAPSVEPVAATATMTGDAWQPQPARRGVDAPADVDPDRGPAPPRSATIEVGSSMYLRGGDGSGGVAGIAPFATFEVAHGWFLRPSLMFGRATAPNGDARLLTHGGGRADFCRRIPGNYIERRGIELDVCGGSDLTLSRGEPIVTAGPSMVLRGELGAGLAVELRGVTGVVLLEGPVTSPGGAPFMGAAELGLSMRLP